MRKTTPCRLYTAALVMTASALWVAPASAEQTTIPLMVDTGQRAKLDLPVNGQTQSQVRAKFGVPQTMTGPVGQPPIRQMIYPDFIVYLEGNRVIHTVLKQQASKSSR